MSTIALDATASDTTAESTRRRPGVLLRFGDLILLALALPIFLAADWPLLGYAVAAVAWIGQHFLIVASDRGSRSALAAGDRRRALGIVGGAMIGRLWLVATAILLVGLLAEREDGLAAAVLTVVLVTAHLICLGFSKFLYPEGDSK